MLALVWIILRCMQDPVFFESPKLFRRWLRANHRTSDEILVGFYRKDSRLPSLTWPESVDEALCFGWIDGVRRRIDNQSYSIRFTPRRKGSIWSAVNIRRANELIEAGLMQPAGLEAFRQRSEDRSRIYAYENAPRALDPEAEKIFRRNRKAWTYFNEQPPGYRRQAIFWVSSAKREETRQKRLAVLIEDSANGRRLAYTVRPKGGG